MITMLGAEHGMTREEAYMLCSVAGDLRMHEVVCMHFFLLDLVVDFAFVGGYAELCC